MTVTGFGRQEEGKEREDGKRGDKERTKEC